MRKQFVIFVLRWALNSFGLWLASRLLSNSFIDTDVTATTFIVAGLILSLANSILKPFVIVLALPAILLTLGLFMLVVNGLMVYIALKLVPGLDISFGGAVLTGIIISLINYFISGILEMKDNPREIKV